MEPAIDDVLKLPFISPFGYDFLYKKLEFDESIDADADSIADVDDGDIDAPLRRDCRIISFFATPPIIPILFCVPLFVFINVV